MKKKKDCLIAKLVDDIVNIHKTNKVQVLTFAEK